MPAKRLKSKEHYSIAVKMQILREKKFGLDKFKTFKNFGKKVVESRIYLAKDNLLDPESFEKSYSNIKDFNKNRDLGISSSLSRRLLGY